VKCAGSLHTNYTMAFNEETDEYTCSSESECARLRCECDATLAIDLARHFVNAGTDDLSSSNLGLGKDDCARAGVHGGAPNNACCGVAPTWQAYNTELQKCNGNGEVSDRSIYF
jgi:hypothetical protein